MQERFKLLFFVYVLIGINPIFSQEKVIKFKYPLIEWVSSMVDDTLKLNVGTKLIFQQNCNPKVDKTILNGTVQFENNTIKGLKFCTTVFFKDTVIEKAVYVYSGKQINEVLKLLGMDEKEFIHLGKNHLQYSFLSNNKLIFCEVRKKSVLYMEQVSVTEN